LLIQDSFSAVQVLIIFYEETNVLSDTHTVFKQISDTFSSLGYFYIPKTNFDELLSVTETCANRLGTQNIKKYVIGTLVALKKNLHGVRNSNWFTKFRTPHMFLHKMAK
jgi:hypothetical protein